MKTTRDATNATKPRPASKAPASTSRTKQKIKRRRIDAYNNNNSCNCITTTVNNNNAQDFNTTTKQRIESEIRKSFGSPRTPVGQPRQRLREAKRMSSKEVPRAMTSNLLRVRERLRAAREKIKKKKGARTETSEKHRFEGGASGKLFRCAGSPGRPDQPGPRPHFYDNTITHTDARQA